MSDLISRADAIEAIRNMPVRDLGRASNMTLIGKGEAIVKLYTLPSADAVSMEEHIKELNDLAVEWIANYDETMAKVAKECEECKERLRNIRQSAEAEPSLKAIKRQIDEHWYLTPPSAEAVQGWIPCSERLPKKGEVVLITNGKGNVRCGQYRSEHDVRGETHYWWWKGKTVETVLAWMPLPKPYEGGRSE